MSQHRALLGLPAIGPVYVSQVRHAYKQAALKWHPDRNKAAQKDECEEMFKQIGESFEILLQEALMDEESGDPTSSTAADRPEQRGTDGGPPGSCFSSHENVARRPAAEKEVPSAPMPTFEK